VAATGTIVTILAGLLPIELVGELVSSRPSFDMVYKIRVWASRLTRITELRPRIAPNLTIGASHLRPIASTPTIATAIRYGLNRWDGLVRFLDDSFCTSCNCPGWGGWVWVRRIDSIGG
jgi:hypothetical protein